MASHRSPPSREPAGEGARSSRRRAALKAARGVVQPPLESLDPSPQVLRHRTAPTPLPPLVVIGVYRSRIAHHLVALRHQLPLTSVRLGFWALDDVKPELAAVTLGSGPGERLTLLNRLLTELDSSPDAWLLVVDDDVRFKRGTPGDLLRTAVFARLDLCQPTHAWESNVSYRFTRRRALTLARRTSWVEQGPVVLFGPVARERLLPFPEDVRWPGWGVEAQWSRGEQEGLVLGMVDGVTVVHTQSPNVTGYPVHAALRQRRELLRRAGFHPDAELKFNRAHWRPWASEPRLATGHG